VTVLILIVAAQHTKNSAEAGSTFEFMAPRNVRIGSGFAAT